MNEVLSGTTWGNTRDDFLGSWICTKAEGDSKIYFGMGNCAVTAENVVALGSGPFVGVYDASKTEVMVNFLLEGAGVDQNKKALRYAVPTIGLTPSTWFLSEVQSPAPDSGWGDDPLEFYGTWTVGSKQIVIAADDLTVSGFAAADGLPDGTYNWTYRADLKALTVQFCFAADGYTSTKKELLYTPAGVEVETPQGAIAVPTQGEVYEEEDGGEYDE